MMTYFKIFLLHCAVLCYIGQISGYNIDLKVAHNDIENLRKYLKTKDTSETEDKNVTFSQLLDDWKEEGEKKLLLSQIVPMYLKMLESITSTEVKDSITNLTQMLHTSNKDYLEKSDQKMKKLNELKKMRMTDIKIQRAAIKELLHVLREVSTLQGGQKSNSKKCKRENVRRRRGC